MQVMDFMGNRIPSLVCRSVFHILTRKSGARPLWWVLHIQQGFLHNSSLQVPNLGNLAARRTWSGREQNAFAHPAAVNIPSMEDSGNK